MEPQAADCERCGKRLPPDKQVWLELSIDDGRYYAEGTFPAGHASQGWFAFGTACAARVLKGNARHIFKRANLGEFL